MVVLVESQFGKCMPIWTPILDGLNGAGRTDEDGWSAIGIDPLSPG